MRHALTRTQLTGYRKALAALADNLDRALARDLRELRRETEPDVPGEPMPATGAEPDDGAAEVQLGRIAAEEDLLTEVAAALARIEAGTFGTCEGCGKAIARGRLEVVPYARHCIRCAKATRPVAS